MRYGENPQQDADFYQKALPTDLLRLLQQNSSTVKNCPSITSVTLMRPFVSFVTSKNRPTVVALKHMNPCGIGQADDIETAWDYAYEV